MAKIRDIKIQPLCHQLLLKIKTDIGLVLEQVSKVSCVLWMKMRQSQTDI